MPTLATQDRAYNVDALTTATLGGRKLIEEIQWDADEPNVMRIMIPNFPAIYSCVPARAPSSRFSQQHCTVHCRSVILDVDVRSRVTRRFQEDHADEYRLDTSELVEQVRAFVSVVVKNIQKQLILQREFRSGELNTMVWSAGLPLQGRTPAAQGEGESLLDQVQMALSGAGRRWPCDRRCVSSETPHLSTRVQPIRPSAW